MSARVFVIDDDTAVRDGLTMLLEVAGYDVVAFSNARSFLEVCPANCEGCIILDVNMPDMDGPALQQELLQHGIQLPIIFLSGYGSTSTVTRTLEAGAMAFLTKPVKGQVLLEKVQEALRRNA